MKLSLFIANRIRKTGSRTGGLSSLGTRLATVAVAVSLAVMVGAIAIANGFQSEIKGKITGFTGEVILAAPGQKIPSIQHPISSNLSYWSLLEQMSGIASVERVAYLGGMVRNNGEVQGIVFKGVDSLYNLSLFADHLVEGRLPDYTSKKTSTEVLLSKRLADRLGLSVGDPLTVYFVGDRIRVRKFSLTGLYNLGLNEFDELFGVADLRQLQHLQGWESDQVAAVELHWKSGADYEEALPELDHIFLEESTEQDSVVLPQIIRGNYRHIYDWLDLLDLNVFVILVLMIVVSGFNMISGLLILLFEKIQMIGLLKALGMRSRQICSIFVARGMRIALVGMAAGNAIALLFCTTQACFQWMGLDPENYFVDHVPIDLSFGAWFAVNALALLAMFLILWLPTLFISRVSPARTLKVE